MDVGAVAVRHDPASAALARRAIAEDLDAHGVDRDCIDDVVLIVSELVGNAVLHAVPAGPGSELAVSWQIDETAVVVHVADTSDAPPQLRAVGVGDTGGRGMAIIDSIAANWGVDPRPGGGKDVWARVAVRPA